MRRPPDDIRPRQERDRSRAQAGGSAGVEMWDPLKNVDGVAAPTRYHGDPRAFASASNVQALRPMCLYGDMKTREDLLKADVIMVGGCGSIKV